jgi:hypothetical protein
MEWQNDVDLEAERQEELNPKRTCSHKCFRMVKVVALVSALAMGIGQIVGIAFPGEGLDPIQYILHIYMLAFCVVMVLTELEWAQFLVGSGLLQNWISRGVTYSFVGVIGISENRVMSLDEDGGIPKAAAVYIEVVAYLMVAVGVIYFGLGAFCCQIVYSRARKDWEERSGWAVKKRKKDAQKNRKKSKPSSASNTDDNII